VIAWESAHDSRASWFGNAADRPERAPYYWADLPADFPPYRRVHAFARRWQVTSLLAGLHDRLRDKVRQKEGRLPDLTAAISQPGTPTAKPGSGTLRTQ
jgi:transposase